EITIEKEQAVNQEAALRAQIREEEGKKDTRRKALGAGAAFAHARIDLVWRDSLVAVLQKAGRAMKTERSRNEMAALVDWVKNGCRVVDIDERVAEILAAKRAEMQGKSAAPPEPTRAEALPKPSGRSLQS
ncbi:MAG: hypothetical protein ACREQ4_14130, partial [Candidatus Binataceae bacterium]